MPPSSQMRSSERMATTTMSWVSWGVTKAFRRYCCYTYFTLSMLGGPDKDAGVQAVLAFFLRIQLRAWRTGTKSPASLFLR